MKAITLIILSIFLGKGCSKEAQNDLANSKIEYIANTRGYFNKVTVQNQKLISSNDRSKPDSGAEITISDKDWKDLVTCFKDIDLDSLATYKDPTQKRFYDGAPFATMKVFVGEKEYESKTFDHGIPPVEIESFVKKLMSLKPQE